MANKLTRNPWIIDTASGTPLRPTGTTQGIPPQGPILALAVVFSGYTAGNTDKAILADADGTTFLTLNGSSDKTAVGVSFFSPVPIQNIAVTTLTSGIVTIFVKG